VIYAVEFAPQARTDLHRLYAFLLDRATAIEDLELAERALTSIEAAVDTQLSRTPFIHRKAGTGNSLRRELVIPFGSTGYVALYEIAQPGKVIVLALRHQLENDYH
jgi:plasmid stabilization system protein ParE